MKRGSKESTPDRSTKKINKGVVPTPKKGKVIKEPEVPESGAPISKKKKVSESVAPIAKKEKVPNKLEMSKDEQAPAMELGKLMQSQKFMAELSTMIQDLASQGALKLPFNMEVEECSHREVDPEAKTDDGEDTSEEEEVKVAPKGDDKAKDEEKGAPESEDNKSHASDTKSNGTQGIGAVSPETSTGN